MSRAGIVAVSAAAVLAAGGIGAAAVLSRPDAQPLASSSTSASSAAPTATPTTTPTPRPKSTDPLAGGKVSNHAVIAAKVENIAAARPQVGLGLADITFIEERSITLQSGRSRGRPATTIGLRHTTSL
jgi:hypothetical protein